MATTVTERGIPRLEAAVGGFREKLVALEAEQQTARQAAEQAEATWRSALADSALGEGGKPAITKARAALDDARESLIALDGALAEIGRRLSTAEAELFEARLAALVERAEKGVAGLDRCIGEMIEIDAAAGAVRSRMAALIEDLMQTREAHSDLDPEGRSPGEIGDLCQKLSTGLAGHTKGNITARGNIALAHLELGWFLDAWRQGKRPGRVLGGAG